MQGRHLLHIVRQLNEQGEQCTYPDACYEEANLIYHLEDRVSGICIEAITNELK